MSQYHLSTSENSWKFHPVARSIVAGTLAGMRSMMAPTYVACSKNAPVKRVFMLMSLIELVGDKLASAPDRTDSAPLWGRTVSGALSAAYALSRPKISTLIGCALIGGAAAYAASHFAFRARRYLVNDLDAPETAVAFGEDALAFMLGNAFFKPEYQ